jgi:hypothetical protein
MLSLLLVALMLAKGLDAAADGHAADTNITVIRRGGDLSLGLVVAGPVAPEELDVLARMGIRPEPGPPVCRGAHTITTYAGEINCGALGFVHVLVEVLDQPEVDVPIGRGRTVVVTVPAVEPVLA